MKRTIFIISALVVMAGYAVPVFGWGQKGHRIIAEIAYDNLSRKARKQVDKTLGTHGMV